MILFFTIIIVIGALFDFFRNLKHEYNIIKTNRRGNSFFIFINYTIAPILISIVGPLAGLIMTAKGSQYDTYDEFYNAPLHKDHLLTIVVFYLIATLAFWLSKLFKNNLSPLLKTFSLLGMAQGFILCIVLTIQLGGFMLLGFFPILITAPLLCPPLFAILLFIELRKQFYYYKEETNEDAIYDSLILEKGQHFLNHKKLENPIIFLFLIPFIAIQQSILILFGQQTDSFIKAFTETATYTFSQYSPPANPGTGHYLCTIAARGHRELVRPIRMGWRDNKKIYINRQLMIANAFEEWLEENSPSFHYYLRQFYNKIGIPLNNFVKNKWISNIIFIIMKPLEWFFLFWLYLVDKKPENRIQRQYLLKK